MNAIWEQRALETVRGTKWAIMKELCKATWRGTNSFKDGSVASDFQTEVRRMVKSIIDIVPDNDLAASLNEQMSFYDPSGENDKRFMEGRLECQDIEGTNTMIIAVGGYHAIRKGKAKKGYKGDKYLAGRASRISKVI